MFIERRWFSTIAGLRLVSQGLVMTTLASFAQAPQDWVFALSAISANFQTLTQRCGKLSKMCLRKIYQSPNLDILRVAPLDMQYI